jgi:pyruvate/2-oxoglutarate dehydrogenase complex dihydrolipoamide acyltransferase (E2) component
MRDGLKANQPPAFFQTLDVDMTRSVAILDAARAHGLRLTYTHLLVRAAALALSRNPDLHLVICGRTRHSPRSVDIALSVAGETSVSPVLILEAVDQKDLVTLAREIADRAPAARAEHDRMMNMLRRWGWLLPNSWLRRGFFRLMSSNLAFRRKSSGTFQVSVLREVDSFATTTFGGTGVLTAGRVRAAVVAVDGRPAVRPTMTLVCCADHAAWDGRAGERMLVTVRDILETGQLECESGALRSSAHKV